MVKQKRSLAEIKDNMYGHLYPMDDDGEVISDEPYSFFELIDLISWSDDASYTIGELKELMDWYIQIVNED